MLCSAHTVDQLLKRYVVFGERSKLVFNVEAVMANTKQVQKAQRFAVS